MNDILAANIGFARPMIVRELASSLLGFFRFASFSLACKKAECARMPRIPRNESRHHRLVRDLAIE